MHLGNLTYHKSSHKIIISFVIISALIMLFVFYTSFSSAKIVLKLRREDVNINFNVGLNKNNPLATPINGRIVSKEITGSDELGEIKIKKIDDYAKGKVIVHNKLAKNLTLVAGSQLKPVDSDIIFKTKGPLILKPKSQIETEIISTVKGKIGELGLTKFTFIKLWSGWTELVYAESKKNFSNGEKEGQIVSEEDLNNLSEKLAASLFEQGLNELEDEVKDNEEIWDQFFKKEIISFKTSAGVSQEAKELQAEMKLKLTGVLLNKEMLKNLAEAKIKNQIIDDQELENLDEGNLTAEIIEIDPKKNEAEFKINSTALLKPVVIDEIKNKEKIFGLNQDEVKTYYKKYQEEIENVEVYFSPFWQKSVPSGNVEIIVE